jgi:ATP-dependent DNA ligase
MANSFSTTSKLGFEGMVSNSIDAPYAPQPVAETKWVNRQEFPIIGWSDPEGSRPHLTSAVCICSDDSKLICVDRVGAGMFVEMVADLRAPPR